MLSMEDLKDCPEQTMRLLCDWMGIEEEDSLYEMTMQGKKWWGDPSSPDFGKEAMPPFGKSSTDRAVGSIFSERDQLVLRTLFYPFSVRFGYIEEDPDQFKDDLRRIRPMLDELFDFEEIMIKNTQVDTEQFKSSDAYCYLRACMLNRWAILNEFGTYPEILRPISMV